MPTGGPASDGRKEDSDEAPRDGHFDPGLSFTGSAGASRPFFHWRGGIDPRSRVSLGPPFSSQVASQVIPHDSAPAACYLEENGANLLPSSWESTHAFSGSTPGRTARLSPRRAHKYTTIGCRSRQPGTPPQPDRRAERVSRESPRSSGTNHRPECQENIAERSEQAIPVRCPFSLPGLRLSVTLPI